MDTHDLTRKLQVKNDSKIVMLVADGLGGLPHEVGGQTELEAANTPNLDSLASRSVQGLSTPVLPGIAPALGRDIWDSLVTIHSSTKLDVALWKQLELVLNYRTVT